MPRLFRTHPGFVAMSTGVLAVSIGINLLVFTAVNALWLRPLPFPDPERVVTLTQAWLAGPDPYAGVFEGGVAGQVITSEEFEVVRPRIDLADAGADLEALGVTADYFRVLRLTIRGRDFVQYDDRDGVEPVAIISDRLWNRGFGRRSEVVGAVVSGTPIPIRVIGIAPPGFHGARRGEQADLWIPTSLVRRLAPAALAGQGLPMMLIARLGPGQTLPAVERQLQSLAPQLFRSVRVLPLHHVFGTPESPTSEIREGASLLVVAGLALLVLLGGCATVAALVLTHYESRRAALAVKMALGAGRRSLMFELACDLALIALAGAAGGVLVAVLGVRVAPALSLPGGVILGRLDLAIDWRVCAVGIAAAVATLTLAAGLPLARATGVRIAADLFAGPSTQRLGSIRVRQVLLAFQVCCTVIVLVAAGLFVRSVMRAYSHAAGFDVERTVFVSVPGAGLFRQSALTPADHAASLVSTLASLPGVSAVAEGLAPLGPVATRNLHRDRTVRVQGRQFELPVGVLTGSPNLLEALGVKLLVGRFLSPADSATASPCPAVITRSLAERLWPGGQALAAAFSVPQLRRSRYLVVGVVEDLAFGSLTVPSAGVVIATGPSTGSSFVVRTDTPELVSGLVARSLEGHAVRVITGHQVVAQDIGRQRLGAWVFAGFGGVALLLGVGGAFGLVAYLAESRRREFGIRLALGAVMRDVVRHGLLTALRPVSVGLAVGLMLGALVSQLFSLFLVGVSAVDPTTYLAVAGTMLTCASTAAVAAGRRFRRANPSDSLRAL